MDEPTVEIRMATLIESIRSLSQITTNHDLLLTKLIDDHEQRLRALEKCGLAFEKVEKLEMVVRDIEIHGTDQAKEALRTAEMLGSRIAIIEHLTSNKQAVTNWWDHTWVRIGIIVGVALGILGFAIDLVHFW